MGNFTTIKEVRISFFLIIITLIFFSCKSNSTNEKKVLAVAFEKKLYIDDFKDIIPPNLSKEDSIVFVKNRINLWLHKQVMLNKAESNLNEQQKNMNRIVEDYRASLLIDKYKQEFIKQKLDTNVTKNEILEYYNKYSGSFKLNREIFKGALFKISKNQDSINIIKNLFFSKKETDWKKFEEIANKKNIFFKDFTEKWTPFSMISVLLPIKILNPEIILKSNNNLNTQDDNFHYFLKITDFKLKGDAKPLELIKKQVKIIIINKRKVKLINELETIIFQKAIEKGNIEFFD